MKLLLVVSLMFVTVHSFSVTLGTPTIAEASGKRIYLTFCSGSEIFFCGTGETEFLGISQTCTSIYNVNTPEIETISEADTEGIERAIEARSFCTQFDTSTTYILTSGGGAAADGLGISSIDLSPLAGDINAFCDGMSPSCEEINTVFTSSGNCNNPEWSNLLSTNGFWLEEDAEEENCATIFQQFDPDTSNEALLIGGLHCQDQCPAVNEQTCSPEGPEYECQTSYQIFTENICNGEQCATVPPLYLGFCYDPGFNCDCTIQKVSGISGGDVLTAGIYEIYSIATNTDGFSSDECSFRVTVVNSCNEDGPNTICREDPILLSTRSSCVLDGENCAKMPDSFLGTCIDKDSCSCSTEQISGPTSGESLLPGSYTIVLSSTNEVGFTTPSTCEITVRVS